MKKNIETDNMLLAQILLKELKCKFKQLSLGNNIDTESALLLADIAIFYSIDNIEQFKKIIYGNN